MKSNRLLAAVVVLQGMMLLGQWTGSGPVTPAYGQIPDAGSQRAAMLDEMKSINSNLSQLLRIVESGKLQVQVAKPDEEK
jgi:hypothetical protein